MYGLEKVYMVISRTVAMPRIGFSENTWQTGNNLIHHVQIRKAVRGDKQDCGNATYWLFPKYVADGGRKIHGLEET